MIAGASVVLPVGNDSPAFEVNDHGQVPRTSRKRYAAWISRTLIANDTPGAIVVVVSFSRHISEPVVSVDL
jgi:hypothetical protein